MGVFLLKPNAWANLKYIYEGLPSHEKSSADLTSIFSKYIERGGLIKVVPYEGFWGEIDNCKDLSYYTGVLSSFE